MASTLRPSQAFDLAKNYIKKMPLEQVQSRILDEANKMIWMAAPWRWSIGVLTNVTLASATVDYSLGTLPADFLYAIESYMTDGNNPSKTFSIEPVLPATPVIIAAIPDKIAIIGAAGASGTLRVFPKPGTLDAARVTSLVTWYKKISPLVIQSNMNTAGLLVMDDEWFWVYEQAVLWLAYKYADDPRAGSIQTDGQQVKYAGQAAEFIAALRYMLDHEKLPTWAVRNALDVKTEKR